MSRKRLVVPVLMGCLLSAPLWADESAGAAPGGGAAPAVWADKELDFVYMGFTTKYSCDGLRDKIRGVLLDLGADKKSLKVLESGCSSPTGRPDPFPGVRAKMKVLLPAGGSAEGDQPPLSAHWQPVDLKLRDSFTTDSGECELMEQIRQKVLPLFSVRNVEFSSNCIPHQATPTRPTLKLEVLKPDVAQHPAGTPPAAQ
jgi:hypothetical protein